MPARIRSSEVVSSSPSRNLRAGSMMFAQALSPHFARSEYSGRPPKPYMRISCYIPNGYLVSISTYEILEPFSNGWVQESLVCHYRRAIFVLTLQLRLRATDCHADTSRSLWLGSGLES